jgi:hypothetical protein
LILTENTDSHKRALGGKKKHKIDRGKDKYREFMVTIRKDHGKENLQIEYHENYWEQHASLVRERIPRFLEDYAEKILKTGKYLNVVAECGKGG